MATESSWRAHALARMQDEGHRVGGARSAVVEHLAAQRCCVSAQEIHDGLRGAGHAVGLASVYRTLELLRGLRLVQRLDVGDGTARYEAAHPLGGHHHHLVCDDCGRVTAFEDETLESALDRLAGRVQYVVAAPDAVLRGRRPACPDDG